MMKKALTTSPILCLFLLAQPLLAQNLRYSCAETFYSPDRDFYIRCSAEIGDPSECQVTVLALKGYDILDSIIISRTNAHDCQVPQFYWSKHAPLLIVETSAPDNGCDGSRLTQVFDLNAQNLLYATSGVLALFDNRRDLAILYNGREERDSLGNVSKFWFNLDAYDVTANRKWPVCSLETYPVGCAGDFELSFVEDTPSLIKIKFLDNNYRMDRDEFLIRY